jgi:hypothetical protein
MPGQASPPLSQERLGTGPPFSLGQFSATRSLTRRSAGSFWGCLTSLLSLSCPVHFTSCLLHKLAGLASLLFGWSCPVLHLQKLSGLASLVFGWSCQALLLQKISGLASLLFGWSYPVTSGRSYLAWLVCCLAGLAQLPSDRSFLAWLV